MKHKWLKMALVLCVAATLLLCLGIGPYSSGAAVSDLKAELESIYGPEYTGKAVEGGTGDMVFEVEGKSWFLTDWNLRNALGLDYKYECRVTFTTHSRELGDSVTTVTYQAVDPMGRENTVIRAHLLPDSREDAVVAIAITEK